MDWNIKTANEKKQKGLCMTLLFYTNPSHSAPQHTPHWLTEQGAIFHSKSNQPMLSRAVWDNQKGYPDQCPSLWQCSDRFAYLSWGIKSEQKRTKLTHRPKTLPLLLFDLYLWPNLYLTMKLLVYFFYFFCHGLISRWPQKSEFMGRTFFGRL